MVDQTVIVGGWAHQLYRLHPHAQKLDYAPLTTLDTDIAVPAKLPAGEQDIRERLMAYGFIEELLGDAILRQLTTVLAEKHLGSMPSLTPLVGSEHDRKHKRKGTLDIAGITSQQLRYIELPLHAPWSIDFKFDRFVAKLQIANPVSFLAQKVLIHRKRSREDRAKDILYMHDTIEVFGARLPELQNLWGNLVAPQLKARGVRMVSTASEHLFGDVSDDIRRAAEISAERALSPETLREACRYGFIQVFATDPKIN